MKPNPVTLPCIAQVSQIEQALVFGYTYFPVINNKDQIVGMISSDFIIVLLKQQAWYSKALLNQDHEEKYKSMVSRRNIDNKHNS